MTGPGTCAIAVPVRELKIFRKIIQREANVVLASYSHPGEKTLDDSTPTFVMREYLEMRRAIGKLDEYLTVRK